mgnify:CR=1 FL=1
MPLSRSFSVSLSGLFSLSAPLRWCAFLLILSCDCAILAGVLKKVLIYSVTATLFLAPLLPLVVSNSMLFPFITGKNFAFRAIVEVVVALWLILLLFDKSYRPKRSWLMYAVLALVIVTGIATIKAIYPYRAFWSNFERMEGYITFLHLLGYFAVLTSVFRRVRQWFWLANTSIAVSVILGIYGLLQLAGKLAIHQGGTRLDATLGNSAYLAVYMLMHVFLTAAVMINRYAAAPSGRGRLWLWPYLPIIALQLFTIYHTATRGALLGLVGGTGVTLILLLFFERRRVVRRAIGVSLAVLVLLVGGFWLARDTAVVQKSGTLSRLASISLNEKTTISRFLVWNMSWQGFKEHPVIGWGPDNYGLVFNKYYHPRMYDQEAWFDRSHNIVFDWLISAGALGLIAYLSLYVAALYYLWRRANNTFSLGERAVFSGLLAAYFFNNFFVFDNIISYLIFFGLLGYFHFRATSAVADRAVAADATSATSITIPKWVRAAGSAVMLLVLGGVLYFANVKPILASRALIDTLSTADNLPAESLDHYRRVFSYRTFATAEASEQILRIALQELSRTDVPDDLKRQFLILATDELNNQAERAPLDARYQYFNGVFRARVGNIVGAIESLEAARQLSPRKQAILFELGRTYLLVDDKAKALAVYREAYELEPSYLHAKILYATTALRVGARKAAEELLIPIYGTIVVDDVVYIDEFINVFAELKEYDKVLKLWLKKVERTPDNWEFRSGLAASYLATGQRQKSIDELRQAEEINPAFKKDADFLINEIRAGRNPSGS